MNTHKRAGFAIALLSLGFLFSGAPALATDELIKQPTKETPSDPHITMHQFEHEMGSYATVTFSMSHEGILTIRGHVDDGITRGEVERLALKVKGVTEVHNYIITD